MSDNSAESEKSSSANRPGKKIAGILAIFLWLLSIGLSFAIPPGSELIWVPDAVLLLGFFPLLWICPYSLVWIAFGILTAFIGFFLLLLTNIPTSSLPAETHKVKEHLAEYHPSWSWMLLGVLGTAGGVVKLFLNLIKRLRRQ